MEDKNIFINPDFEVIRYSDQDIIRTSGFIDGDQHEGEGDWTDINDLFDDFG